MVLEVEKAEVEEDSEEAENSPAKLLCCSSSVIYVQTLTRRAHAFYSSRWEQRMVDARELFPRS